MAAEWAGMLAALVLGIEIGRFLANKNPPMASDSVTRATLDAELARFERRLELDLGDAQEKLTNLYDRARKRVEVPPRKAQDASGDGAEASSIPPRERAREKARRLGLWRPAGSMESPLQR